MPIYLKNVSGRNCGGHGIDIGSPNADVFVDGARMENVRGSAYHIRSSDPFINFSNDLMLQAEHCLSAKDKSELLSILHEMADQKKRRDPGMLARFANFGERVASTVVGGMILQWLTLPR